MTMIITRRDAAPQGGDDDWLGGRIEEYKGHRIGLWKLLPPNTRRGGPLLLLRPRGQPEKEI